MTDHSVAPGDRSVPWRHVFPKTSGFKPVKYVCSINARSLPETTDPDTEFRYVDISNVDSDGNWVASDPMRFGNAPSRARRVVADGDVLVSTVRTYLRAIAHIDKVEEPLVCSTGFAVLSANGAVASKFLAYWARSVHFVDEVVARSVGVSYPAVNAPDLGNIPCPVPPLDEQRAIARFLDRETARIDALIEKKRRQIDLLHEKRAALISHAVTKGLDPTAPMKDSGIDWLGAVPAHWSILRLRRLGKVDQGCSFPHAIQGRPAGDIPWYKVNDMNRPGNEVVMHEADNYVDADVARGECATLFPEGTVVFPRVGAALLTNKRRMLSCPAIVDDNVYGFIPSAISSRFAYYVLTLIDLSSLCSPGLVPTVTIPAVKDIEIPFPPTDEQGTITNYLDGELSRIDATAEKILSSVDRLREYRTALISAAVTGKIDVRQEVA